MAYKRKQPIRKSIPNQFGKQLDLVVKLLHTHLNRANKRLLFDTLKEIQKVNGLSLEFIRNLILSSSEPKSNKHTYSNENRQKANQIIRNFGKILKRTGIFIDLQPRSYTIWKNDIDLYKTTEQGVLRKFTIQ